MNKPLRDLMQKEMTRKEFLTTLGLGVAAMFGFSSIIKLLSNHGQQQRGPVGGYGSSTYGG